MKKIFCLTILAVLCTFGVASAQQFPSVQIETQDGKTIDTKTLIDGKTPVIISFWSTTCKPCIKAKVSCGKAAPSCTRSSSSRSRSETTRSL